MSDEQKPNRDKPEDSGNPFRKGPPPWLPKLPDFQEQQRKMLRDATSNLLKVPRFELRTQIYVPQFDFGDFLSSLRETIAKIQERIDADRLLIEEHAPSNWPALDAPIEHKRLHNVALSGIPVAWLPRAEVLIELADCEPDAYLATLSRFDAEIVEDCQRVTEPMLAGPYSEQAVFIGQCLEAFSVGAFAACQALAAVVAETALRYGFVPSKRFGWGGDLKAHINESKTFEPKDYRRTLVLVPFENAYRGFDYEDTSEDVFGRNITLHRVDSTQYTPANALVALMLAVSALRETHEAEASTN